MTVGTVVAPFGVRGEVQVEPATDYPERFRERRRYYLDRPRPGWAEVAGVRFHRGRVLVKFSGCDDRDAAAALRGARLQVPAADLPPLPADTYYHHQLLGLVVVTPAGEVLGRVEAIHRTPAHDLLEVRRPQGGSFLVPAVRALVAAVDPAAGRVVVAPPPGLLTGGE